MRNRNVLQRVGALLCLLDIGSQPVGGIFHHGQFDGQFFHTFKCLPGFIQGFPCAVVGVGGQRGDRICFDEGNFRPHDASRLNADGILDRDRIGDRLHMIDADLHVGGLKRSVSLSERDIDL